MSGSYNQNPSSSTYEELGERSQKIPESQIWRETVVKKQSPNNSWTLFNRPDVAGAVLQSPMLLINLVGQRVIHFFSKSAGHLQFQTV